MQIVQVQFSFISSAKAAESPYLQRLSHTHVVPTPGNARSPQSATGGNGKPRVDPKFIADPSLWDPATPRPHSEQPGGRKKRPASAPIYKRWDLLLSVFDLKCM